MNRLLTLGILLLAASVNAIGETESIDLKALAKKARPAVMLLIIYDKAGNKIGTGTGFLISNDGRLITDHHVLEGGASAIARAENGGNFAVEGLLADDATNDLSLLKLDGKGLPFLSFGHSDKLEVGTRLAVIGSPLGLEGTLSEGIVSAVRELAGQRQLLQITAAISPGSSGSPVLNASGEVIGVAKAIINEGQSLNFAVPSARALELVAKSEKKPAIQPLTATVATDDDEVTTDELIALADAELAKDNVELLKRAQALVRRKPRSALAQVLLGGV